MYVCECYSTALQNNKSTQPSVYDVARISNRDISINLPWLSVLCYQCPIELNKTVSIHVIIQSLGVRNYSTDRLRGKVLIKNFKAVTKPGPKKMQRVEMFQAQLIKMLDVDYQQETSYSKMLLNSSDIRLRPQPKIESRPNLKTLSDQGEIREKAEESKEFID